MLEALADQRAERAAEGKREVHWSAHRKDEAVSRLFPSCGSPARGHTRALRLG